ncbi:dihydroorotase [Parasegetibacter sp. NRK P23]|uniref:dihydroorotase n=1 Tax=Parasegetibacter sp. NRK P23 TaxID=2942999 RepID=UPI00204436D2|nr:dihydroorotase [Parasegetibacter sp. NRK P23]MCM5528357.1 dihydroorotase [Parasegetibacter sp. NRK P23]
MKVLIRQALIADPQSPFYNSTSDILIENGKVSAIGTGISAGDAQVIEAEGLVLSPGWLDVFSHFNDPGLEYKETLETGAEAAAKGGYTDVMVIPNTNPVVHNKTAVEYLVRKSAQLPVRLHPIGAISKNAEGKDLAEMYDMHNSGAVAFSDGVKPVQQAGIMLKALQYVKAFDGVVIQVPDDTSVGANGLMNEGIVSTRLGLPGKPIIAEELMVARDIKLARYTGSKLHFTAVTSAKSLEYIQRAKSAGLPVTCSVTPYHLYFCDEDMVEYDSNLKVNPPLRTAADRDALREAVRNGLVDCIASHHLPQDEDHKVLEFEYAQPGMLGLQTAYAVVQTVLPDLPADQVARLFSINPRGIFGFQPIVVEEGAPARFTLFAKQPWTLEEHEIASLSKNTPFTNVPLEGKVFGIINGNQVYLNS